MLKEKINHILSQKNFEIFITFLVSVNVFVFVLQTDDEIMQKIGLYLNLIEYISLVIFTLEYILRLYLARTIKDIVNLYMFIDLIAIVPCYLSLLQINTLSLRIVRIFRLFLLLKMTRYSNAMKTICQVFIKRKDELIFTGIIFALVLLISSTLMYFAEYNHNQETEDFQSILSTFWWSVITCTTVGYGDVYPVTTLGKLIAGLTAIIGVALHGVMIGVISSAFFDIFAKKEKE